MIDDIDVNASYLVKNRTRMDYFIPNYLEKLLSKNFKICSVGCGTGYDVELLVKKGYDAYGFDPGNRVVDWINRSEKVQKRLKVGYAEDMPFGENRFDFMYALEVIEHVGCKNGNWQLLENYTKTRENFLNSCLAMLRPNGKLLISSSNKLFPIDVGHGHHYNKLTNFMASKGIALTIPWHSKNFLLSYYDFYRLLKESKYRDQIKIQQISSYKYPSFSNSRRGIVYKKIINGILLVFNVYPINRLNPILVILIEKTI